MGDLYGQLKEGDVIMAKVAETMPEQPAAADIPTILTEKQKRVFHAVKNAAEPRRFESVTELSPRLVMQVPEIFYKEYPDREYAWGAIDDIESNLDGGFWQTVTRGNHSRIPDIYFDLSGAVLFKGQNILIYTWKHNIELREKKVLQDFAVLDKGVSNMSDKQFRDGNGNVVGTIERTKDLGEGRNSTDLDPDAKYDFGD